MTGRHNRQERKVTGRTNNENPHGTAPIMFCQLKIRRGAALSISWAIDVRRRRVGLCPSWRSSQLLIGRPFLGHGWAKPLKSVARFAPPVPIWTKCTMLLLAHASGLLTSVGSGQSMVIHYESMLPYHVDNTRRPCSCRFGLPLSPCSSLFFSYGVTMRIVKCITFAYSVA